jgi:hypothetical protein
MRNRAKTHLRSTAANLLALANISIMLAGAGIERALCCGAPGSANAVEFFIGQQASADASKDPAVSVVRHKFPPFFSMVDC